MSLTIVPTEDTALAVLRAFILTIVPNTVEVVQAQANRVPEPDGDDFILMTPTTRLRLATNVVDWGREDPAAVALDHSHDTQFMVQLDLHGPNGGDYAQTIGTLFRDQYGCEQMAGTGVQPLFATDGTQMPFRNGEQQYENRWVMTVALQVTPIVSTPQDFAATLTPIFSPVL